MHFHFSFYSSILLLFFLQGILFSALLLKKAIVQNEKANRWLAGFIFLCSLNIVPWMLGHAGWYSLQPYRDIMFYLPLQNFFLLGPFIFFYTRLLLNPGNRFSKKDRLHLIPGAVYIAYSIVMFVADKLILHQYWFYADGHDRDLDNWYRLAGIVSLSGYLLWSLRYYSIYKKLAGQVLSVADSVLFRWIKTYLVALLFMQVCDILFFCFFPAWGSFTSKWWYYFMFSVLFYYVALSAYASSIRPLFTFRLTEKGFYYLVTQRPSTALHFLPEPYEQEQLMEENHNESYNLEEDEKESEHFKTKILEALKVNEVYKNPALTLTILAKQLQTNPSVLSKAINKGFGMNFNDLINYFRVEAVKTMLAQGEHKRQTLLGIAIDCGFNSKTTFNRSFKKHAALSPKEYIKHLDDERVAPATGSHTKYSVPNHDLGRPTEFPSSS